MKKAFWLLPCLALALSGADVSGKWTGTIDIEDSGSTIPIQVELQTFSPGHYAIQAAAMHDVNGFYKEELAQRKRLGYPPYSQLIRLEYRHYDPGRAEKEANVLAANLQEQLKAEGRKLTTIIGPAPCFFYKLDGKFRWQIVLRGADLTTLLRGRLSSDWRVEVEPISLL